MLFTVSSLRCSWFIQVKLPNRSEVPKLSDFIYQQNSQINMRNQFKTVIFHFVNSRYVLKTIIH